MYLLRFNSFPFSSLLSALRHGLLMNYTEINSMVLPALLLYNFIGPVLTTINYVSCYLLNLLNGVIIYGCLAVSIMTARITVRVTRYSHSNLRRYQLISLRYNLRDDTVVCLCLRLLINILNDWDAVRSKTHVSNAWFLPGHSRNT